MQSFRWDDGKVADAFKKKKINRKRESPWLLERCGALKRTCGRPEPFFLINSLRLVAPAWKNATLVALSATYITHPPLPSLRTRSQNLLCHKSTPSLFARVFLCLCQRLLQAIWDLVQAVRMANGKPLNLNGDRTTPTRRHLPFQMKVFLLRRWPG